MANTAAAVDSGSTAQKGVTSAWPHPDRSADVDVKRTNSIYLQRPGGFEGIFGAVEDFHAGFHELSGRPLLSGGRAFWKDIEERMKREFMGYLCVCVCVYSVKARMHKCILTHVPACACICTHHHVTSSCHIIGAKMRT